MQAHIQIKLFATLNKFTPVSADRYPVVPGTSVRNLLQQLDIPANEAKLIFINGTKGDLTAILQGGDRVAIFPPIGGG